MKKYLFLLALCLSARVEGAALPDTARQELIADFSGGLNTTNPSHKIDTKYSPYMRNVFIDNGKIERINGFVTVGSSRTLQKVTGIYPFVRENGQTTFIVTDSSLTLETADFKSWVFVSSNSSAGALLTWMQVRNKMWGFNGVDSPLTWDGTTKVSLNGSGTTPNVPKFRYGAYYQDRVWGFNIPNGASDLYFSATITTDNIIIAPDTLYAWPAINATYVGRGDGQVGTALWVYQGLLRAGKEQSIYTVYGDNPSAYNPRKEEANVGVASNESVRVMDGEVYYLSKNGIYKGVARISDLIEPDVAVINDGLSSIIANTWESQVDFSKGQFFGSTATTAGLLKNQERTLTINTAPSEPNGGGVHFSQFNGTGATSTGFAPLAAASQVPADARIVPGFIGMWGRVNDTGLCASKNLTITARNLNRAQTDAQSGQYPIADFGTSFSKIDITGFGNAGTDWNPEEVNQSSFSLNIAVTGMAGEPKCVFDYYPATNTSASNVVVWASSKTQFMSEVTTLPMITAWYTFDSVFNTNAGIVNLFFRTSTSAVNITTQVWTAITPGTIISAPIINNYIQWASTMNGQGTGPIPPSIDNVTISHIEGQASDARAFATDWKNRYWLTVTTTSNSAQRLTYVKSLNSNSVPNAWMPIEGYPIACYAKSGDTLYGGAASTGIVYRLDYGTNFDGSAINSIYETPDLSLSDYFFDKNILKYLIDGDKSVGGTMTVRSSVNGGSFTSSTFTVSGTGRYTHIVEGVTKPVKTLRLRLQNNELDIGLGINNVNILYEPTKALSNQ